MGESERPVTLSDLVMFYHTKVTNTLIILMGILIYSLISPFCRSGDILYLFFPSKPKLVYNTLKCVLEFTIFTLTYVSTYINSTFTNFTVNTSKSGVQADTLGSQAIGNGTIH